MAICLITICIHTRRAHSVVQGFAASGGRQFSLTGIGGEYLGRLLLHFGRCLLFPHCICIGIESVFNLPQYHNTEHKPFH